MYEIGKYIGEGGDSYFFRLRKYPRLGVKIRKDLNKTRLEEEFAKAQILQKLGVPVPRFVGLVRIVFPNYFGLTLEKQEKRKEIALEPESKNQLQDWTGKSCWGLLMEIIEHDLSLISSRRIDYYYYKELEKIEKLGIRVVDSHFGTEYKNILWSNKKRKLYFIDFDWWVVPYNLLKEKR